MHRRLAILAVAAATAVVLPILPVVAVPADGTPAVPMAAAPAWDVLARCSDFSHSTVVLDAAGFHVTNPYGYSWDQSVLTPAAWRRPPTGDSVRTLLVYGLTWTFPLLRRMRDAPDVADRLESLVVAVSSTATWRPDNGLATDPVWNEGVVTRRQQTLNCLYELTHDARLVRPLLALVRAAEDPARYYGPPRRLPHNHGLTSNLVLIDTARLLGRSDIRAFALDRLTVAIRGAFTPSGLSIEQSTAYHLANMRSWAKAERALRADGSAASFAAAGVVRARLVRAAAALAHLTDPAGTPVPFGDGAPSVQPARAQRALSFLDPAAGVLTGRWHWSSTSDFYAVRFGGPRRMHGHEDRGSVVWSTRGVPVLVDPGTATYAEGAARGWTISAASHSGGVVSRSTFRPRAPIALVRWTRSGWSHGVTLRGAPYGHDQLRAIVVDSARHALTLTDRVVGGRVVQVLQLDPRWRPVSVGSHAVVCIDGAGHRLVIATTGTVSSVRRGRAGLAGGWVFTYPPSVSVPAPRVLVSGGSSVRTILRVR